MSPNQIKTRKVSLARLEGNQISSLWILFFPPSLPPDQSCNPWRAGGVHLEAHSTSAHHERAQGSILPLPAPRSLFFVLPPSDQVPSGQNPSEGQHSCSEEAPRMNRALAQAQCPLFSLLGFCSPLSTSQKPFYSPGYLQRARDFSLFHWDPEAAVSSPLWRWTKGQASLFFSDLQITGGIILPIQWIFFF